MQQTSGSMKQVRFQPHSNSVGRSAYSIEESKKSWMSKKEFDAVLVEANRDAIKVRCNQRFDDPRSYANVAIGVYTSCLRRQVPSNRVFRYFMKWKAVVHDSGLERYSLVSMETRTQGRVSHVRRCVLETQRQLVEEGMPVDEREVAIQEIYEKEALPERMYARLLGIVAAAPVQTKKHRPRTEKASCLKKSSGSLPSCGKRKANGLEALHSGPSPTKKQQRTEWNATLA